VVGVTHGVTSLALVNAYRAVAVNSLVLHVVHNIKAFRVCIVLSDAVKN
jgi:hypothetical protein